ncbi:hypothetical protein CY35_10G079500 [Sphagnum magellanicum]|nr:hypothetical protein CY35_10G079500 [Sphagnum magellanicum]KAH9550583.1 hypothetical protein CY35_10G079500 [Sphagnum magellanicum]KAH9550587.1 hypothetical protein CY35_10G079500 [Sphagnum magellanicum]KAH9550588.1 hypothetical protein CY35_10G079500 [Sphagnum magellanicum]KAH9550589.1 hypothetical protein CY35_10G079500 [Sphagnum magellanicum]
MQQKRDRSLREMETGSESYESGGEEGMEILEEEEEEEEDKELDFRKLCLQEGWMADDGEEEEEEHELQGSQLAVARASVETTTTIPAWEEEDLGMGELEKACVTSSFSSSMLPPLEKGGREKKILGKSLQRKNECIEESSLQMLDSMSKPPPPPPPPPAAAAADDDDDDNGGAEMIEISPEKSTQLQVDHKGCRHDTMETEVLDMLTVDAEKETAAAAVMDVVVSLPAHDIKKQSNFSAVGKEEEEEDHFQQFGNTNSLAEEEAREVSSQQDVHDPTSANEYPANCNGVAVTEVKKVPEVVELSTSCSPCIPIVDDDCTAAANALAGKDESHKEENLQQQRRRKKDGDVEEERVVEGAVVIVHHVQQCDNNQLLKNHHRGGVVAEEDPFLMGNRMGCCCLDAEAESKHNRAENEGGAIRAAASVADDGDEKDYGGGGASSSSSSLLYNSASFGNTCCDNGVVVAEEEDIKQEMEEEACNGEEDGDRGIDVKSQKRKYVGEAEAKQKQQQVCKLQNELLQEGFMLAECPPHTPLPPCGGGGGGCAGDVQQSDHCASVAKQNQSMTHATSRARCVDAKLRQPPAVGFTAHQLGQLYSLMHEHVQLLIQVFALSILEPAQQQTAIETHHMLVDLMQSRDWMLMWKKTAFPDFCFGLPFIHPSVVVDNSNSNSSSSSSSMCDPSPATKNPHSQVVAAVVKLSEPTTPDSVPSEIRNTHLQTDNVPDLGRSSNSQEKMLPLEAASQTEHRSSIPCPSVSNVASVFPSSPSEWVPKTCGSVQTLLDVAPLRLVNEFLTDIAQVVQNYRQQHVESGAYHAECERDTLFPTVKLQADHDLVAEGGSSSKKKQSVALVPKGISKSVRRFLPLFNKGLFPNKAPPATTANRMLFTDAEDELLAMGMITYNTDWLAIQQRFLPSKSVHQIFVRQKNRSCARSPENPIKAVRRMKSAPFTAEEKECIEEALKVYKYDWARIWQFCVPHRDPVALPRQWRIALGTQKLYESHETNEEKRQAYETGRHLNTLTSSLRDETPSSSMWVNDLIQGPVKCSGDGDTNDTEDKEAHILNAFFAEWKPRSPLAWLAEGRPCMPEPSGALSSSSTIVSKTEDHMKGGDVPTLPVLLPLPIPAAPMLPPIYPYSAYAPPIHTFPSRQQAKKWLVKLAPGLPSLKLPPTVQVLSQSKGGEHPKTVTHLGCSRGGAGSQVNLPGPQGIELTGSDAIPPIKPSTVLPPASSSRKASVQEEVVLGKRIKCDWQLPNPDLAPKRKCVENDAASINNQIAIQYNQAAASVRQQRQPPPPRSHPVVSQQQTAGRRSLKTLLMKPASSSSPATRGRRTMPFPIATPPSDDIKVLAGQVPLHYQSPYFHPFFGAPPPTPIVSKTVCERPSLI